MSGQMEYVRQRYGVPAKRGALVRFQGDDARILSAPGGWLRIRSVRTGQEFIVHPTWEMEYPEPVSGLPT